MYVCHELGNMPVRVQACIREACMYNSQDSNSMPAHLKARNRISIRTACFQIGRNAGIKVKLKQRAHLQQIRSRSAVCACIFTKKEKLASTLHTATTTAAAVESHSKTIDRPCCYGGVRWCLPTKCACARHSRSTQPFATAVWYPALYDIITALIY